MYIYISTKLLQLRGMAREIIEALQLLLAQLYESILLLRRKMVTDQGLDMLPTSKARRPKCRRPKCGRPRCRRHRCRC